VILKYLLCDDWFIYSYDPETGKVYYLNTEMWPEWDMFSDDEIQQPNAVEMYMLPIALSKYWNTKRWNYADTTIDEDEDLKKYASSENRIVEQLVNAVKAIGGIPLESYSSNNGGFLAFSLNETGYVVNIEKDKNYDFLNEKLSSNRILQRIVSAKKKE